MALLFALGPASLPQAPRIRSVGVIYEFVKRTTILGVK